MIYFNMNGAFGAPRAIGANGGTMEIAAEIGICIAQIYAQLPDEKERLKFKKTMGKVCEVDSKIWTEEAVITPTATYKSSIDLKELKRQAEELNRE